MLNILRDLSRLDGVELYELAERYGATVRTIRRDLGALEAAGLPLAREPSPDGKRMRWRLEPGRDQRGDLAALLDASHYLALRVAMNDAGALARETGLYGALEDLAGKIERAVGPRGRGQLAAIERCFISWDKHAYRSAGKEHLWPLVKAIEERRICRVRYHAASGGGEARSYEVLPLRLFVHDRAAYLLCQFQGHREVGTLNLHRLEHLEVTGRVGKVPAGFDPAKWAEPAFSIYPGDGPTTYVLRFDQTVAPFIRERVWHPSQELRELRGGEVELRFTCGESYEVTSWVANWREGVEVLAPKKLRRELAALGRELVARYSGGG
ncbi:helix-turn-helix transcriptional regulator [Anaeromyxobacter paludicola]|uniref:helix-turn-helix transcriptional regulator n=1 Tax=Anaeromyxobacter paludicola TaxID=2918171 RepID=UPI0020BEE6BC|nr:WYL domain-containing protein [Anaeromyxobacter paludicola]